MKLDTEFFFDEHNVNPSEAFSRLVKTLRKQKGMTQEQMAKKLGISQKTYSALERRLQMANFTRVHEVIDLLDYEIVIRHKTKASVKNHESLVPSKVNITSI